MSRVLKLTRRSKNFSIYSLSKKLSRLVKFYANSKIQRRTLEFRITQKFFETFEISYRSSCIENAHVEDPKHCSNISFIIRRIHRYTMNPLSPLSSDLLYSLEGTRINSNLINYSPLFLETSKHEEARKLLVTLSKRVLQLMILKIRSIPVESQISPIQVRFRIRLTLQRSPRIE